MSATLFARARRGTHAIFATRVLSVVLTLASIAIFARLIPPADFGIWAMASFAVGLVMIVRELGLAACLVQAPELSAEQRSAYFWASVGISLVAAALLALAAPLLAALYGAPLLQPVLWGCAVSVALYGFGFVHAALLRRELQYRRLMAMEGGCMLFGLAVGLTAAWFWRDVWALVAGHVASACWTTTAALVLGRWRPQAPSRRARIDVRFTSQLTLYNVLTYLANNVGLAAGARFGAAELGFFNRGQQFYQMAHFSFLTPITEMGFALLCRLRGREYRDAYVALARRVALLFLPLAVVLPLVADDLVLALLGATWAPAAPAVAWFAPAIAGQAFAVLLAQLMTSQGRGAELRAWAAANLALRAAGAVAGSAFGIAGMAAGFSLATLAATLLMVWLAGRSGPVVLRDQLVAVWPGVLAAGAAALGGALVLAGADVAALGAGWGRLLGVGGGAVLAWAALCAMQPPARAALAGRGLAHG
jgi:O-antigen/teichoic acid export membrane protein